MPVEFLADEEAAAYGAYRAVPSQPDLEKLFFLDDVDRQLIAKRRGAHNRLGFALLLTTVRYLGVFLPDPLDVPDSVTGYLAGQLEISDPGCVQGSVRPGLAWFVPGWEEGGDHRVGDEGGETLQWPAAD